MTSHSPNRAVRPGAYLFEPCVLLRDFPHRAVDFLSAELRLSLHDEEEKAKLEKKNFSPCTPVTYSEGGEQNTVQARDNTLHLTSVGGFQNTVRCGSGNKQPVNRLRNPPRKAE